MGVPSEVTVVQPQQQALTNNEVAYHQPTTDNAIATVAAPPTYIQNEKSATPGVPRSDDPARVEMAYSAAPVVNNTVRPLQSLTEISAYIDCPFCHQRSETEVKRKESETTWIYTILCCLCCGLIGVLFPILLHWANDFDHFCKTCGNRVARVPHDSSSNNQVQVFGPTPATVISEHKQGI